MTKVYLMASRKAWHHEVPDGWTETHWERFDYIECGIYEKPDAELSDADREFAEYHLEVPDGWIEPRQIEKPRSGANETAENSESA